MSRPRQRIKPVSYTHLPFLGAITLLDKSAVDENEIETQTTDAGAADTETAAE